MDLLLLLREELAPLLSQQICAYCDRLLCKTTDELVGCMLACVFALIRFSIVVVVLIVRLLALCRPSIIIVIIIINITIIALLLWHSNLNRPTTNDNISLLVFVVVVVVEDIQISLNFICCETSADA